MSNPFQIKVLYDNEILPVNNILFDDTVEIIKEKIFLNTGGGKRDSDGDVIYQLYPDFQKLTVVDPVTNKILVLDGTEYVRNKLVNKDDSNKVLTYFTVNGKIKDNIIKVETLVDTVINNDIDTPNQIIDFKVEYPKVNKQDLEAVIYLQREDVTQEEERTINIFFQKVERKGQTVLSKLKELNKAYSQLESDYEKNISITKNGNYSIISAYLEFKSQTNLEEKREFIDFDKLFNQMKTSQTVPFISYSPRSSKVYTKVYDLLRKDPYTKDLIENWILVEKDRNDHFKTPQGMTFRVLVDKEKNIYIIGNLFKDGKIFIRCSFTNEYKASEKDIKKCIDAFNNVIDEINKIKIALGKESKINKLRYSNVKYRSLDAQLNLNINFDKSKLHTIVKKSIFKPIFQLELEKKTKIELCEELLKKKIITMEDCKKLKVTDVKKLASSKGINLMSEAGNKNQLIINYIRVSIYKNLNLNIRGGNVADDDSESTQRLTIAFKSSDDNGVISLKNVKNLYQIDFVFNIALSLVNKLNDSDKNVKKNKKIKKLDLLKKFKVPYNSRVCQKFRQPFVDNDNSVLSESQLRNKGTYSLKSTKTNNTRLVCYADTPEAKNHIFPGYTNEGIPCCFKDDQRNSKQWANFHSVGKENENIDLTDLYRNRNNIINTKKLLLPGRIGKITDSIGKYFTKYGKPEYSDLFRIGVSSDNNSFLNAMFLLIKDEMKLKSIAEFKSKLIDYTGFSNIFSVLQNGNIKLEYNSKDNYIKSVINNIHSDHKSLLDLVALFAKKNIFIFSEKSQNIICYSDYSNLSQLIQKDKDALFLIKNNTFYEPILNIKMAPSSKSCIVTTFFKNSDNIVKVTKKLYKLSCENTPRVENVQSNAFTAREISSNLDISYQIVNDFNKVILVVVDDHLIPVKPTGPLLKIKITKDYKRFTKSANETIRFLNNLDKSLKPIAQILNKNKVIALLLKNGFSVPVSESDRIKGMNISQLNFSIDIAEAIRSGLQINDHRLKLLGQISLNKNLLHQVRFELSSQMNNNTRKEIERIILNPSTSDYIKRNELNKIITPLLQSLSIQSILTDSLKKPTGLCRNSNEIVCNSNTFCKYYKGDCKINIPKDKMNYIKKRIIQELITDTISQLIIKGLVTLEVSDLDEFIRRPNETVLVDVSQAREWLKGNRVKRK